MKDLAIYGAGGLGREVACVINNINEVEPKWNLIGFFDDGKAKGEAVSHFGPCLGGLQEVNDWMEELSVVLAFGSPSTLEKIHSNIINPKISFPNIIHPSFNVDDVSTFRIGTGNIIAKGCSVTTNVSLGNFNLLNGNVGIGHDSQIGNYNVMMPEVKISGEVRIGNANLFGCGSFVKQQLKVGIGVTLSPLSALLTKPKDGNLYIGNPAKLFKTV